MKVKIVKTVTGYIDGKKVEHFEGELKSLKISDGKVREMSLQNSDGVNLVSLDGVVEVTFVRDYKDRTAPDKIIKEEIKGKPKTSDESKTPITGEPPGPPAT